MFIKAHSNYNNSNIDKLPPFFTRYCSLINRVNAIISKKEEEENIK